MDITTINIDIATLRSELVQLMKEGFKEIPLTALLIIIKANCIIEKEEPNGKAG